jgi:ethanolamine utilization cobalamin adenosyltransferase
MLYTEEAARANIRNRGGKRVFFLGEKDTLTPGARDFLHRERIEILPASQAPIKEYRLENGAVLTKKPEHMTHLHGDVLVLKTHPRIGFRGAIDTLESELLWCQSAIKDPFSSKIGEILSFARDLIRCEVLDEPVHQERLCGLTEAELRQRSHRPQDFYNQPHFMPSASDGNTVLALNRCRTAVRAAELAAARAFTDIDGTCRRTDILQALNRMSSMVYILMIQAKSEGI